MVDFSKRLGKKIVEKPTEPKALYERLDRASDKGPLRDAQKFILDEWHEKRRNNRDVIIKLHTGQGKTLIGLLVLQSKLNEGAGPALYLCPNTQLVDQTCEQAKQFGITVAKCDRDIPPEFSEGKAIIVTTAAKLFNGLTKFKLSPKSLVAGAVLMDDSHACVDAIRDCVSMKIGRKDKDGRDVPAYQKLVDLFSTELRQQGAGTFEEIKSGEGDSFLPVPYWAWSDKSIEVTEILAVNSDDDCIKFVWPILKDKVRDCLCIVSGSSIEIVPYLAPLDVFGPYWNAKHRVFMSATVTDDSFLIKGLRLEKDAILNPLTYPNERWSGEKMILIPSLIHDELDRDAIVGQFGPQNVQRNYGVVALVPSFLKAEDWGKCGALVARRNTIDTILTNLKNGVRLQTVVFANRYDGMDLADDQCRILIFDSLPHGENLYDRYTEQCRPGSDLQNIRLARAIEQGLGRSVRGEKDYSIIVITGAELINFLRQSHTRAFLSEQTRRQVEIGVEVSGLAKEDASPEKSSMSLMMSTCLQCLKRDETWKEYYRQEMDTIESNALQPKGLESFEAELSAETYFECHDTDNAVLALQKLVDSVQLSPQERGFYIQEMARYRYSSRKADSAKLQISAHSLNRILLRPIEGAQVERLDPLPGLRIANIITWAKAFDSYEQLKIAVDEICSRLDFGTDADDFERAVKEVGKALGFSSERPEKEWKAGPDNLWCLKANDYLVIECKNEVMQTRQEINKHEVAQMNTSIAWFRKTYQLASFSRLMIISTHKLGVASVFSDDVGIVTKKFLDKLRKNFRAFFGEFRPYDLKDIDDEKVNGWLIAHKLTIEDIKVEYRRETSVSGATH